MSRFRRLGQSLGLIDHDDGQPERFKRSRYTRGHLISPRLDEDMDDLGRRLTELERRLNDQG